MTPHVVPQQVGRAGYGIGDWCWHARQSSPCRVIDRQDVWSGTAYCVWLPGKDAVVRARAVDLVDLSNVRSTVEQILHTTAAAAKLLDALEDNLLLAPIQSSVVPLPHQLYALNRAMSRDHIRYLLADEVGLGKTIDAGLILRELKPRGMVRRVLVVAPKGLVRQWQAEMRLHFGEHFRFIKAAELAEFHHKFAGSEFGQPTGWSLRELQPAAIPARVFVTDDGRTFVPTAKRIWDLLLTENVTLAPKVGAESALACFETSLAAAKAQGERLFAELLEEHRTWLAEERERSRYAFDVRFQAIGRIGLPVVREHRRKRLEAEHETRMAELADEEVCTPDLNAVLMLRIGRLGCAPA